MEWMDSPEVQEAMNRVRDIFRRIEEENQQLRERVKWLEAELERAETQNTQS